MVETLSTLDGERVDVDQADAQFAAAMAAPPVDKPGRPAPGKRPPEPPADPAAAPHGWTFVGGEWRPKKAPGRPRHASPADKPRVTDAPPPPASPAGKSAPGKVDYRKPLKEVFEAAWFVLAASPIPQRAFGFDLGGLRRTVRVQAALIEGNTDALAGGVNLISQHNGFIGRAVSRLSAGEGGLWVLPAVMLLAPFVAQTGQLWSGQLADDATLDAVAAQTEANVRVYLEKLATAAAAAAGDQVGGDQVQP